MFLFLFISSVFTDCDSTFDIVVAADVLSYIGELAPTIAQAAAVLRPGGHLVFTVEVRTVCVSCRTVISGLDQSPLTVSRLGLRSLGVGGLLVAAISSAGKSFWLGLVLCLALCSPGFNSGGFDR